MITNNSYRIHQIGCRILLGIALQIGVGGERLLAQPPTEVESIVVPVDAADTPMPHFWEQMFGSGRAILSLRDSYRQDLRAVKAVTDLRYVRFHNILHDEVGLFHIDASGRPVYNFSYVDQIYDGLLENGIRPFIEIDFMPFELSSNRKSVVDFWYRPNRAPPKSYSLWDDLVRQFVAHLVERYGIAEVSQWYFEVWNEPNIDFWSGTPKKSTYFELYDHTARDIKSVSKLLRVGGPSTAQAAWVREFLQYTTDNGIPVDFVSSHVYANDTAKNVFGSRETVPRNHMVCRAAQKVRDEIMRSAMPGVPFILSEFNASYANEPDVTDGIYMGPWLADTVRQCAGVVDLMSYWTFSDVFEEHGVVRTPFFGGFGLIAERGIPKPAYNAFALLHKLGERRVTIESDSALVTKRADGTLVIALWNYAPPDGTGSNYIPPQGLPRPSKRFMISVPGAAPNASIRLWRLDADHGNVIKSFDDMGRPAFPTLVQIEKLKAAARMPDPESAVLRSDSMEVMVPSQGLALIELSP
jgi:xylan 1,4-beta-xylosidase